MSDYIDKLYLSGQEIPIQDSAAQERIKELDGRQADLKRAFSNKASDITACMQYIQGGNLCRGDDTVTDGYMGMNGAVYSHAAFVYTEKIPVQAGWTVRAYNRINETFAQRAMRFVTVFDENGSVLSNGGADNVWNYTVPSGINSIVISMTKGDADYMIGIGPAAVTSYAPYSGHYIATDDFIGTIRVKPENITDITKTGRTIQSDNIFGSATLLDTGKYVDTNFTTHKLTLRDNESFDSYIIPVDGGVYSLYGFRFILLLEADQQTPVGALQQNLSSIDTAGAAYMALSFNNSQYSADSVKITHSVSVYELPVNWQLKSEEKRNIVSVSGPLADGGTLEIAGRSALKDGELIAFKAMITAFGSLRLNFTNAGTPTETITNYIEISSANIAVKNNDFSPTPTAHGLTIQHDLALTVQFANGHAKIALYSGGGKYTLDVDWTQTGGTCSQPKIVSTGTAATEAKLTIVYQVVKRPIWIFGDSYLSVGSASRWPYHLLADGYGKTALLNGSQGMTSGGAVISFQTLLQHGTPKMAVFATGMNDGSDANDTPPSLWTTRRDMFLELCAANGITPIFCTIPSVPTVNNEAKNAWVRSSGHRYIDFAGAVGADENGSWYAGMLGTDNVHPSELGARALYTQALMDLPELAEE